MNETWKDVAGYEGLYQVSDLGRVRSFPRRVPCSPRGIPSFRTSPGKTLKQNKDEEYFRVVLCYSGIKTRRLVHHLVLETFIGKPPEGLKGLHRDDDQHNNKLDNLYWGTLSENAHDAIRNGYMTYKTGEDHHLAKFTNAEVIEIRRLYDSKQYSQKQLCDKFNKKATWMHLIVKRKNWIHI